MTDRKNNYLEAEGDDVMVKNLIIQTARITDALMSFAPIRNGVVKIGLFIAAGLILNLIHDEAVSWLLLCIFSLCGAYRLLSSLA